MRPGLLWLLSVSITTLRFLPLLQNWQFISSCYYRVLFRGRAAQDLWSHSSRCMFGLVPFLLRYKCSCGEHSCPSLRDLSFPSGINA